MSIVTTAQKITLWEQTYDTLVHQDTEDEQMVIAVKKDGKILYKLDTANPAPVGANVPRQAVEIAQFLKKETEYGAPPDGAINLRYPSGQVEGELEYI